MRLRVGLLKANPGWEILLRQIGVSWDVVDTSRGIDPAEYAVVIANEAPGLAGKRDLLAFVEQGGSLLVTGNVLGSLRGTVLRRERYTYLLPRGEDSVPRDDILDIFTNGYRRRETASGSGALSVEEFGKGCLCHIPFDPGRVMVDERSRRKNFYAPRRRLPSEKVSTVSRGPLRRWIAAILEHLYHRRNIPFVHAWYYPHGAATVFTFRIDSDAGTREDVEDLYRLCDSFSIPATWFLDTRSHERWLDRFAGFRNQECGVHCYTHLTFTTLGENLDNFSRAFSLMQRSGLKPCGGAAPFGTWNRSVSEAFEQLGLPFSSEFSLDYDDLPFTPWLGNRFSPVLQLPVHPVCIGSMMRSRFTAEEMQRYFVSIAERKLQQREPIAFYHHPTHRQPGVCESIFEWVLSRGIPRLSYSAYAAWWEKRMRTIPSYRLADSSTIVSDQPVDADVYCRIAYPTGEESILPSQSRLQLSDLPKQTPPRIPELPADIGRARTFDPRHPLIDALEGWYKYT